MAKSISVTAGMREMIRVGTAALKGCATRVYEHDSVAQSFWAACGAAASNTETIAAKTTVIPLKPINTPFVFVAFVPSL
jgi:hypothetical protein